MEYRKNMESENVPSILTALDQLATQSNQALFLYNLKTGHLDFINHNFRKIWETADKDLAQEWLLQSIHPNDLAFVKESYRGFLNGEESKHTEFRLCMRDGAVKWLSLITYYMFEDTEKHCVVGLIEEITARKERENVAARHSARNNEILDILSHDIKGALALIGVMSNEIKKGVESYGNEQVNEYARLIGQLCQKNNKMIHSLLETEFLDSANVTLVRKRLDLVENILTVFSEYKHSERMLDRHFHLSTEKESAYIEVDEVLFTQVFNNLISNAVKFTPDGGSITVCLEEEAAQISVCVRDDGVGIPKHLHPVLFDRFTKARRRGIKGEGTTGLGMSIVKRIIELHGGRIWVESDENEGTSVFFTIPKMTAVKPL